MRMANLAGRALSGFLISSHSIRTKRRRFADHSANRPAYAGPQCQDQTSGCGESEMTKPIDEVFERCTQTRSAVRGQSRVASSSPQCVSIPVLRAAAPPDRQHVLRPATHVAGRLLSLLSTSGRGARMTRAQIKEPGITDVDLVRARWHVQHGTRQFRDFLRTGDSELTLGFAR
jgi:hypothetical protein